MDLGEFLLARIAEDEEAAKLAAPAPGTLIRSGDRWVPPPWSGSRVLAECEVKREMVGLHARAPWVMSGRPVCGHDETSWPCADLRLLALPHADHPDYDPEWKP